MIKYFLSSVIFTGLSFSIHIIFVEDSNCFAQVKRLGRASNKVVIQLNTLDIIYIYIWCLTPAIWMSLMLWGGMLSTRCMDRVLIWMETSIKFSQIPRVGSTSILLYRIYLLLLIAWGLQCCLYTTYLFIASKAMISELYFFLLELLLEAPNNTWPRAHE
jgi:hypothetical protein